MIPKLILFDADGTLRTCTVPGQPCPNEPDQWRLLPNVRKTISNLGDVALGIISNQAGVAYGYLSEGMANKLLHDLAKSAFGERAYIIDFCPHAIDAGCECRKPKPRMLERCMNITLCEPGETLFVGDQETDKQAAQNARCAFIWAKDFFKWRK